MTDKRIIPTIEGRSPNAAMATYPKWSLVSECDITPDLRGVPWMCRCIPRQDTTQRLIIATRLGVSRTVAAIDTLRCDIPIIAR